MIIKRYSIVIFFLLTLALSWGMWIPAAIAKLNGQTSILGPDSPVGQFARWAPGIVAIALALLIGGKAGMGRLLRPVRIWRISWVWYVFALFFSAAIFALSWLINTLLGNAQEIVSPLVQVYGTQAAFYLPFIILFAIPGAFAEELGWRGFALPRLQGKTSALPASLVVGIIWGIWHIPNLIYFEALEVNDYPAMLWIALNMLPIAVLYAWLYNNTKGSLLLVTLFHVGDQLSNNLLGSAPGYTDTILVWIITILVIVLAGPLNLSRQNERIQVIT